MAAAFIECIMICIGVVFIPKVLLLYNPNLWLLMTTTRSFQLSLDYVSKLVGLNNMNYIRQSFSSSSSSSTTVQLLRSSSTTLQYDHHIRHSSSRNDSVDEMIHQYENVNMRDSLLHYIDIDLIEDIATNEKIILHQIVKLKQYQRKLQSNQKLYNETKRKLYHLFFCVIRFFKIFF